MTKQPELEVFPADMKKAVGVEKTQLINNVYQTA
jgi:hypothetical protein